LLGLRLKGLCDRGGWPGARVESGRNAENQIEGRGPTEAAAWRPALEQARLLGMLGGVRPGRGDGGVEERR
jgi:hypothetical protein